MAEGGNIPSEARLKELLKDCLECVICEDIYNDPRPLVCGHTFCAKCVDQIPCDQEERTIKCPKCRTVSRLPEGGAAGLPPADDVNTLMELYRGEPLPKAQECPRHHCAIEQYCVTCQGAICGECEEQHSSCALLDKDMHRCQTQARLASIQRKLDSVSTFLDQLHAQREDVDARGAEIKLAISSFVQSVKETLERSETQQLDQVNMIVNKANDKINDEIHDVETLYAQLKSCKDYIERRLQDKSCTATHVMKILSGVDEMVDVDELVAADHGITCTFHQQNDLVANCEKIGIVSKFSQEDLSTGVVESATCMLGKEAQVVVKLENERPGPLNCQAIHSAGHIQCQTQELQERKGVYRITFTPTHHGTYRLFMQKDINCSRSMIEVSRALRQGPVIRESQLVQLAGPTGVCIAPKGMLVVTEKTGTTVRNKAGHIEVQCQQAYTLRTARKVFSPRGVAITPEGHILAVDWRRQTIQKYSINGFTVESPYQINGRAPCDIVVKRNGCVHVTYTEEHQVKVFNHDLSYSHSIGEQGSGIKQFNEPLGVALDAQENLYVCDSKNSRVLKFSSEEEQISEIRCDFTPRWIAIDSNGMIYITSFSEIVVFDSSGNLFDRVMTGMPDLEGIAVDDDGRVFVCCSTSNQILVYND